MLVLSRKDDEKVIVRIAGEKVVMTVLRCNHGKVRLGFDASDNVTINRAEIDGLPPEQRRELEPR